MSQTAPLRFALEELYVLQQALKLENLPGFKPNLLEGLSVEQQRAALAAADDTLRARNFIGWRDTHERVVNPNLELLLRDYAQPLCILFVDTLLHDQRGLPFLYVYGRQGIYEQCEPEPGVVQLRIIENERVLRERLTPRARLMSVPELDMLQGQIEQRLLWEGLSVVREDKEKAGQIFAKSLPVELADGLAAAYHQVDVVQYLATWEKAPTAEEVEPAMALTILLSEDQMYLLWIEKPVKGAATWVSVIPATPRMLEDYIQKILPQVNVH